MAITYEAPASGLEVAPIEYAPSDSGSTSVPFGSGVEEAGLVNKPSEGGSFNNESVGDYATSLTAANLSIAAKNLAEQVALDTAADLVLTNADVVSTNADKVATNADVVSAEADKVQTGLDRTAVAADLVLTNADVVSAEADKVQTGLDKIATNQDVVYTNQDVVYTNADVVLAEADKVQTGLDRIAVTADLALTNADVVLTHADVVLTHADLVLTNADVVLTHDDLALTHADVVLTHADVVLAEADKVQTGLDRIAVSADLVLTNADVVSAEADKVQTGLDRVAVAADLVLTNQDTIDTTADLVLTNADVVLSHADVVLTNADVVSTNADAASTSTDRTAIESIYDTFDDRYLGTKATDPTLDNDGAALLIGAMYFNSTVNNTKFYNGSSWEDPEYTATTGATTATTKANESAASAAAALVSEGLAEADKVATNADVVLTNADVVLTHANVVLAEADKVQTGLDRVAVAADLVATNQDTIDTAADLTLTNADVVLTHADVVLAEADKVQTGLDRVAVAADLVLTNQDTLDTAADLVLTNADVVLTHADVILAEADKVQTGLDKVATNADVVLTNADVVSAEADKVQTGLDRVAVAADKVATNADVVTTNTDSATSTTQAGIATTKASEAATSATNAASSASGVNTSVASFQGQYASQASAPNSPSVGDLWFDTSNSIMKVYTGVAFVNAGSSVNGVENSVEHTATAAQTTFAATYDVGYLEVYLNGIRLDNSDYTANNGTSIILGTGATVSDTVFIHAFGTFELADHYNKVDADARYAQTVNHYTKTAADARFEPIDTAYTKAESDANLAALVDSSPATLDTLNELAAALGDDPNYATTTATAIGTKLPLAGGTMTGDTLHGDNVKATYGAGADLEIFHDGARSIIRDSGTGNLLIRATDLSLQNADGATYASFVSGGAGTFNHNNSPKLATTSTGIDVTGVVTADGLTLGDNEKATFGAGGDLEIYHDGSHSRIADRGTGDLRIYGDSLQLNSWTSGENYLTGETDGAVTLFNNGAAKLTTTSTGIDVTGTVTADGLILDSNDSLTIGTGNYLYADLTATEIASATLLKIVTNSAERMRIDSSGNVGIGTNSPAAALDVVGGAIIKGATDLAATFKSSTDSGNASIAQIRAVDSNSSHHCVFEYKGYQHRFLNDAGTERMRIDSSGKVGIGTATSYGGALTLIPSANPTTASATTSQLRIGESSANTAYSLNINYMLNAGVYKGSLQAIAGGSPADLLLNADGGNVGIGTSSPDAKLKIDAGATAGAWVRADNYGLRVSAGSTSAHYALRIADSNDATMATFNGDGNVGIGTSSPTEALHISSGGLLIDSYIPNAPASGTQGFIADYAGTNTRLWSRGNATTRGGFEFKSLESDGGNQIDAMRIDSSGRVTTPNQPAWNVGLNGAQTISAAGDVVLWDKASGGSNFVSGGVTLNGANGRITLPVAGKYLIVAAMRTEASGGVTGTNINLRLNGATLTRFYVGTCLNSGGSYMNIEPRPFVVNAQASDYLYYDFDGLPSSIILSASTNTVVSFSGYLIG